MRRKFTTNAPSAAMLAAIGLMLAILPASAATAPQPPRPGCVAASKLEYQSAIKNRTRGRFGEYVTTRKLLRRYYWYCPG